MTGRMSCSQPDLSHSTDDLQAEQQKLAKNPHFEMVQGNRSTLNPSASRGVADIVPRLEVVEALAVPFRLVAFDTCEDTAPVHIHAV